MEKCPICKNEDFLHTFNFMFSRGIDICPKCDTLVKQRMIPNRQNRSRIIIDMLSSLSATQQWIEDYQDKPKMIQSFNNRLRELSEELWIILHTI